MNEKQKRSMTPDQKRAAQERAARREKAQTEKELAAAAAIAAQEVAQLATPEGQQAIKRALVNLRSKEKTQ